MYRRILLSIAIITSLLFSPAPAKADTTIGGLIKTDLTLTKERSPYLLASTLQIPTGRTVTVDPGVEIRSNGVSIMFWNQGNLLFNGTRLNPIRLTGHPGLFFSGKNSPFGSNLKISGVFFEGGDTLLSHEGYGGYQSIVFEDSEVIDVLGYVDVWYPPNKLVIQRNVFINSGGFSVGFRYSVDQTSVSILDNLFIGPSTTNFWIQVWASYDGGKLEVHGNEFRGGIYTAVRLAPNSGDTNMNASGNYWGNRSIQEIGDMVLDSNDSLEYQNIIDVSSPLSTASKLMPKDSILLSEAKLAAELKAKQEAESKAAADKAVADLKARQEADAKIAADKAAAELKAKQDAESKAAADLKAKQEAEAKAAADLKAKQDADAKAAADKAAADLKAKQDADAKAAAELKAKQEADAKAAADKAAADAKIAADKVLADAKAAAELKAKQEADAKAAAAAKAAALKKTTITCIKGKITKKVTTVKPVCPVGYKKKV